VVEPLPLPLPLSLALSLALPLSLPLPLCVCVARASAERHGRLVYDATHVRRLSPFSLHASVRGSIFPWSYSDHAPLLVLSPSPRFDLLSDDLCKSIIHRVRDGDLIVLALQSTCLRDMCVEIRVERGLKGWTTKAASSGARLIWAREFSPQPFTFTFGTSTFTSILSGLALHGVVAAYKTILAEGVALSLPLWRLESRFVFRCAGASGSMPMIGYMLDERGAMADSQVNIIGEILDGAVEFDHLHIILQMLEEKRIHPSDLCNNSVNLYTRCAYGGSTRVFDWMLDWMPVQQEVRESVNFLLFQCVSYERGDLLRILYKYYSDFMDLHCPSILSTLLKDVLKYDREGEWSTTWDRQDYKPGTPLLLLQLALGQIKASLHQDAIVRIIESGQCHLVRYIHTPLSEDPPVPAPASISSWDPHAWMKILTSEKLKGSLHVAKYVYHLHPHIPIPDRMLLEVERWLLYKASSCLDNRPSSATSTSVSEKDIEWQRDMEMQREMEMWCANATEWLIDCHVTVDVGHATIACEYGSKVVLEAVLPHLHPTVQTLSTLLEHSVRIMDPGSIKFGRDRVERFQTMVDYLLSKGALWSTSCVTTMAGYHATLVRENMHTRYAARRGRLQMIRWMVNVKGAPIDEEQVKSVHPGIVSEIYAPYPAIAPV
jgi:hypothetical protein